MNPLLPSLKNPLRESPILFQLPTNWSKCTSTEENLTSGTTFTWLIWTLFRVVTWTLVSKYRVTWKSEKLEEVLENNATLLLALLNHSWSSKRILFSSWELGLTLNKSLWIIILRLSTTKRMKTGHLVSALTDQLVILVNSKSSWFLYSAVLVQLRFLIWSLLTKLD